MLLFEAFFKFANLGVMLLLAALIVKSRQDTLQTRLILLVFATTACTLLATGDEALRVNAEIALPLRLFDAAGTIFIWLLGLSLFIDNFRIRITHWLIAVLYVPLMVVVRLYYMDIQISGIDGEKIGRITWILSLSLMGHLGWTALKGRNEDLIEGRRKARVTLSIAIVVLTFSIVLVERFALFNDWEEGFSLALYILYVFSLPLAIGSSVWLARFEGDALKFHKAVIKEIDEATLEPRDKLVFDKLIDTIEAQRGFAEHGLTIGKLSERMHLPAHQLRSLINNTLGYSNFSSFLNHYRIEEVKKGLANPELARTPILTLALDAGFATLSTFNRAFKMEVGITPTDFRTQALKRPT